MDRKVLKTGLVSIIIVNWNGLKWLPECFGSLTRQQYENFEIIFVDNASRDGSVAWVKSHYPKTRICVNRENLGFADGNNVGFRIARGEYVLFLNNDTRVTRSFLTELARVMKGHKEIAGAQSKILLMDKPDMHDSVGAFLTPTGFLYHYGFAKKDQPKYDKQIDLYNAKGACMMFRREVLDTVAINGDIFDPRYFAYFEETDMCHRIWLAGYRIVYAYKSVIYHKMGATSSNLDNVFVQYHSFKNRIATYIKNLNGWNVVTILGLHLLFTEAFATVSLFRGKVPFFIAIQKAIWWNIVHYRQTLRWRRVVQRKIRKVTDGALWPFIMKRPSARYYLALLRGDLSHEDY